MLFGSGAKIAVKDIDIRSYTKSSFNKVTWRKSAISLDA